MKKQLLAILCAALLCSMLILLGCSSSNSDSDNTSEGSSASTSSNENLVPLVTSDDYTITFTNTPPAYFIDEEGWVKRKILAIEVEFTNNSTEATSLSSIASTQCYYEKNAAEKNTRIAAIPCDYLYDQENIDKYGAWADIYRGKVEPGQTQKIYALFSIQQVEDNEPMIVEWRLNGQGAGSDVVIARNSYEFTADSFKE
ncbi:MAG: DUF5067 domain-containing protein [Coriobacteriales bacterium]|nr:DUF5067 domain-containing protein [Coriobacteriales bacterium]